MKFTLKLALLNLFKLDLYRGHHLFEQGLKLLGGKFFVLSPVLLRFRVKKLPFLSRRGKERKSEDEYLVDFLLFRPLLARFESS